MHDELKWNKVFGAVLATGLAILALGVVAFLIWSRRLKQWPFEAAA